MTFVLCRCGWESENFDAGTLAGADALVKAMAQHAREHAERGERIPVPEMRDRTAV